VYVGRSLQSVAAGPVHCMVAVVIQDHGNPPGPRQDPRVHRRVQVRTCPAAGARGFQEAGPEAKAADPGRPGAPVVVSVDLSRSEFAATVGGRELLRAGRNRFLAAGRAVRIGRAGGGAVTPTFAPSEGVGLFLNDSPLAVRSARLERLGG
jgi:hypothetical protein